MTLGTNYILAYAGASLKIGFMWDGFLQPINDTAHDVHTTAPYSSFKTGRTIPVKFELKNAAGQIVTQTAVVAFSRTGNLGDATRLTPSKRWTTRSHRTPAAYTSSPDRSTTTVGAPKA